MNNLNKQFKSPKLLYQVLEEKTIGLFVRCRSLTTFKQFVKNVVAKKNVN